MQHLLSRRLAQGPSSNFLAQAIATLAGFGQRLSASLGVKKLVLLPHNHVNRVRSRSGFALIESVVGMVLVSLMLSCVFAMNSQIAGLLKQGKESTYATQMIQERVEQLRTSLWDEVTDPAKLTNVAKPATATSVNLPGVTETIKVEPLVNPGNVSIVCVRDPAGTVTTTGTAFPLEKTVKVTLSVQWASRSRVRERGMVTVLTTGGI